MKLEHQVVSLDLSKQLKEAGYPQKGLWWWVIDMNKKTFIAIHQKLSGNNDFWYSNPFGNEGLREPTELYVAPTVAELGERLPKCFVSPFDSNNWRCFEDNISAKDLTSMVIRDANTEANTRAKMWLYLKKEGKL